MEVGNSRFMTHTNLVQPHIPFGLDDQQIILNQLYRLALNTSTSNEEVEIMCDILS